MFDLIRNKKNSELFDIFRILFLFMGIYYYIYTKEYLGLFILFIILFCLQKLMCETYFKTLNAFSPDYEKKLIKHATNFKDPINLTYYIIYISYIILGIFYFDKIFIYINNAEVFVAYIITFIIFSILLYNLFLQDLIVNKLKKYIESKINKN